LSSFSLWPQPHTLVVHPLYSHQEWIKYRRQVLLVAHRRRCLDPNQRLDDPIIFFRAI
ncbi:hypothetical protein BD410DRAFT_829135, partial [Rickenella mellea]